MVKKNLILISVLLIGIVIRLVNINQSFWLDEAAQALMSSRSVQEIWFDRIGDFHPPLFYLLAHYWLLLGRSEVWLRILPISFGILNIFIIYKLTQFLYPGKIIKILRWKISPEIISALFLSISPFHVYYSQEFRSYSLLCLLGTLSIYSFLQLLKNSSVKNILCLSLVNSLLLYTHYSSVFLIFAQILYVISFSKKTLKYFFCSSIISALFYFPWIPQLFIQLNSSVQVDSVLPGWKNILSLSPLKATPLVIFKLVAGRINIIPKSIYAIYIGLVLLASLWSMFISKAHSKLLYVWVFSPVILMIIVSFVIPQTQPFRLIYILPGLLIFFTEAMFRSPKTFLVIMLYISIFGNLLYFTRPRLQREQWRQASEFLLINPKSTLVKFPEPFAPLLWYQPNIDYISVIPDFNKNELDSSIWLIEYLSPLTDPNLSVEQELKNRNYVAGKTYNFEGVGFITEYNQ